MIQGRGEVGGESLRGQWELFEGTSSEHNITNLVALVQ